MIRYYHHRRSERQLCMHQLSGRQTDNMNAYILLAALCVVPFASSMYINPAFGGVFDHPGYDAPDTKIYRRNAFGQIQAFDVSHDTKYVPNGYGGVSRYNIMEISDPDIYTNTVVPGMRSHFPGSQGFNIGAMNNLGLNNLGMAVPGLTNTAGGMAGGVTGGITAGITAGIAGGVTGGASVGASRFPMTFQNTMGNFVSGYPYLG